MSNLKRTDLPPRILLNCDTHGPARWHHIICNDCGAVFDLDTPQGDPRAGDSASGMCPACGAALLPSVSEDFTARAICCRCAEAIIRERGRAYCKPDPGWEPIPGKPTKPN